MDMNQDNIVDPNAGLPGGQCDKASIVKNRTHEDHRAAIKKQLAVEEEPRRQNASLQAGKRTWNGHYELKNINGNEYWYYRYHDGKTYRSVYIGKRKDFDLS